MALACGFVCYSMMHLVLSWFSSSLSLSPFLYLIIFIQIDHVTSRFEERMQRGMEIFQWFKMHVLDCKLEPSIGHQELVSKCILSIDSKFYGLFQ